MIRCVQLCGNSLESFWKSQGFWSAMFDHVLASAYFCPYDKQLEHDRRNFVTWAYLSFIVGNVFCFFHLKALIIAQMLFFCHVPSDFYVLCVWWHLFKNSSLCSRTTGGWQTRCKFLSAESAHNVLCVDWKQTAQMEEGNFIYEAE